MRAVLAVLAFAAFAAPVLAAATSSAADAGAPPPSPIPACIAIKTESRYVPYGYNHVVIATSGCTKAASCTVTTDVNPEPVAFQVPAGKTVEVLTFTASPSQTFTAKVACKLDK